MAMGQCAVSPACSQDYSFTGNPAALGYSPLGRKLCVPVFRQVCRYSLEKSVPCVVRGQAVVNRMTTIQNVVIPEITVFVLICLLLTVGRVSPRMRYTFCH